MAVQITGRQIANAAVGVAKLSLSTGSFDFSSGDAVVSVNTPTADGHAASKGYVDSVAQGLHWKDSVKVATTANITLSGTQTIDGVAISADERVLVKNQSSAAENGVYLCKAGAWERAADMNEADEFSGAAIFVQQGTANADKGYVCTNDGNVTVGSTAIAFTQFTGAGQLTAGNGIDITNSTISADLDGSTLTSGSGGLKVSDAGIGTSQVADSAITNAKLANSTISGVALGSNLNALSASASGAITMSSYNGSAAVSNIAVNVAGSGGLEISSNALQIKASSVTNAMLAGSIGADKLSLGNGVENDSGNLIVSLDGGTLALGAGGLSVASGGIGASELAADSVVSAKIADGAIDSAAYLANGVVTTAKLAGSITADKLSLGNGVENSSGSLIISLDGGTLALGAGGLSVASGGIGASELAADSVVSAKIADGAIDSAAYIADSLITSAKLAGSIANAKLANSTISGVALGANLNALSAGNGISMSSYNGSAAVNDLTIDLDGSTLAVGASGLKVSDGGVGTSQLAADCITNAKLADDSVQTENLNFAAFFQAFDADGSTLAFDMAGAIDLAFKEMFVVTVNGLVMEYKDSPDAQDNYKIDNGGTGSVGRIVFGSNLANGDRVTVRGFVNN